MKVVLLLGVLISNAQTGYTQSSDLPLLNTLGRHLGIGYTRGGYHAAADGRLDAVVANHPSHAYGSQQLFAPYSAHYQPVRTIHAPQNIPSYAPAAPMSGGSSMPGGPRPTPAPVDAAPKPTSPPPQWLKEYLQEEDIPAPRALPDPGNVAPEEFERGDDELLNDPADASPFDSEGSPSDRLLEDEDDLLLQTPEVSQRIRAPGFRPSNPGFPGYNLGQNRYKQAIIEPSGAFR
jgi:hypothetical protein